MKSMLEMKKKAAYKAVDEFVDSGMVVGLGTGSTAFFAIERLGHLINNGDLSNIIAVSTSTQTEIQAEKLGIPLTSLNDINKVDVAIDGADIVDPDLNLVKGGGGALFREKLVELTADKFVVIVDESKISKTIGPSFPIPVEITPYAHEHIIRVIRDLPSCKGCNPLLRMGSIFNNKMDGNKIALTDNGNYIIDLHFEKKIANLSEMAKELNSTTGIVEHGLFCGLADVVVVSGSNGIILKRVSQDSFINRSIGKNSSPIPFTLLPSN